MNNDEALQLAKQGFTAEEIRALGWTPTSAYNEPKIGEGEKEDAAGAPESANDPDEKHEASNDAVSETLKSLTDTVNSLTETVKAMQVNNQKTAKKTRNENAPKSADEVIKGFVESM